MIAKQIRKQLKAYSAMAGAVAGMLSTGAAQIQYTDIDPDTTLINNGDSYFLDLNNDAISDFQILFSRSIYSYSYSGYKSYRKGYVGFAYPLSSNSIDGKTGSLTTSTFSYRAAYAHKPNVPINSNNNWGSTSSVLGAYLYQTINSVIVQNIKAGEWLGQKDKYLGLKLVVNNKNYFGWVRLDVDSLSRSITIKDYAYRTKTQGQILTGDTGVITSTDPEIGVENVVVYHFAEYIYINVPAASKPVHVQVYDIPGREIISVVKTGPKIKIPFNSKTSQFYLVKLTIGEATLNKKIYIQSAR